MGKKSMDIGKERKKRKRAAGRPTGDSGGQKFGRNMSSENSLCGLVVRVSGYRSRGPGFDSRPLSDFLRNRRSTQSREDN
jgi:hypothetical protein